MNSQETVDSITSICAVKPLLGLILGSGLGSYADTLQNKQEFPFEKLPHFPKPTVVGHSGKLIIGETGGVAVAALQGRIHFYEGYSLQEVTYPTRILGILGIRKLIITNAAGGINMKFRPGDLMVITDHLNLMGTNPLIGPNPDELGDRFPDMSDAYDSNMRQITMRVAAQNGIPLQQGIYAGLSGPSYETPAEIRMLRILGADAVGMSTVPEVIVANHMRIPVLGLSCITNMAAGILPQKLTHQEVLVTTEKVREQFAILLSKIVPKLASHP
jgi:purine-nucleoside phosphorylase